MPTKLSVISTEDGSLTLHRGDLDVSYRSLHGAASEARYVFLESSGLLKKPMPWTILELGFGGGRTFVETALAFLAQSSEGKLSYHTIERDPLPASWLEVLYPEEAGDVASAGSQSVPFGGQGATRPLRVVGRAEPSSSHLQRLQAVMEGVLEEARKVPKKSHTQEAFEGRLTLHLYPVDWLDAELPDIQADAIYHDPFGPKAEPASWSAACFAKYIRFLRPEGRLVTYSAATSIRKALREAGWLVAKAPGVGRKKEITIAALTESALGDFPRVRVGGKGETR